MSVITVTTPFNIDVEFRIAPFHKRLLAWIIDIVLIYAYIVVIEKYLVSPLNVYQALGNVSTILLLVLPAYSYHLLCEVFMDGQSLGKKALGIKVMDMHGDPATLSQYLLRWLFRMVDMGITIGAGAVLSAALSKYSQRLGDMAAGTVVIDKRARTDLNETIYLELEEESYVPVFREVMQLSDRDINGIRNLLDSRGSSRDTDIYMAQVAQKIREVLHIQTELEPRDLLSQLLKDYNYLTRK